MLNKYRVYSENYPIQAWVLEIASMTFIYFSAWFVLYFLRQPTFPPGMWFLVLSFLFGSPTRGLVQRFSEARRREKPMPLPQERGVGMLSIAAAVGSIASFGGMLGRQRSGLLGTADLALGLGFVVCAFLSISLGYAVRHTRLGWWSLLLSAAWVGLLILFILVAKGSLG